MPKSRHTSLIPSPSSKRATNRRRSSITEVSLHGIDTSRPKTEKCNPCLRYELSPISQVGHHTKSRAKARLPCLWASLRLIALLQQPPSGFPIPATASQPSLAVHAIDTRVFPNKVELVSHLYLLTSGILNVEGTQSNRIAPGFHCLRARSPGGAGSGRGRNDGAADHLGRRIQLRDGK